MNVSKFGGWLIGTVLLFVGATILFTEVDPLVFCLKQCNLPRALSSLFGPTLWRIVVGGFFVALGGLFIVPLLKEQVKRGARE